MMHHTFGAKSQAHLDTVVPELRSICINVLAISPFDLTVTCGRRSKEDQEKAVREGRSKVHWPDGKHNVENEDDLAKAVDIHPYPIDFKDTRRYYMLAGMMHAEAAYDDIKLRWGGDWDGDGVLTDQTFDDLPHFEVVGTQ